VLYLAIEKSYEKYEKTKKNKKIFFAVTAVALLIAVVSVMLRYNKEPSDVPIEVSTESDFVVQEEVNKPKYSVEVLSVSNIKMSHPNDVQYTLKITNFSVEPYITNFSFHDCTFIDNQNNTLSGSIEFAPEQLDKAILPGESKDITLNSVASLSGYQMANPQSTYPIKCEYDSSGNQVCSTITNFTIQSCNAYITADGGQASNQWGHDKLLVDFQ